MNADCQDRAQPVVESAQVYCVGMMPEATHQVKGFSALDLTRTEPACNHPTGEALRKK